MACIVPQLEYGETDCIHLVWQVMPRSGHPFRYYFSWYLSSLP